LDGDLFALSYSIIFLINVFDIYELA
jgi:hypothetical protein